MAPLKGGEDWDFWGKWERGEWEPETRGVLERFLTSESTYIDVGAWIGPTVRWGAPLCKRVVALEPDPVAYSLLVENTADLPKVECKPLALVGSRQVTVELWRSGDWGDSMSSTRKGGVSPIGAVVPAVTPVPAVMLADIWDDACSLVKVDIEGGEADVLPNLGHFLRERGVPLFLSVHEPWIGRDGAEAVHSELAEFESVETHADNRHGFYEVLCR